MSRHLVTALKLVFVAVLLYFVFSNVAWQDTYVRTDPVSGATTTTAGAIEGPWDTPTVRFRPAGAAQVLELEVGAAAAGVQVVPGIVTYWRNLRWGWFLLGALCYVVSATFAATRWWWLLRVNDLPVSFWAAQKFSWIGIFFNNVIPGQTGGDLVKAIYVMKRSAGARVPAMMSVVVDRIMGLASLALLAAISVLFYLDRDNFGQLALALWAILGAVVLLGVVAFSRRIRKWIRLKAMLEKLPEKISVLLKRIDHAVYFYRSHKGGMAVWLFAGIFNHMSSVLSYAFIGTALGVGIPVVDYFVLIPIIVIVSAVPIAPNGWGVGEFMFQKLFGEFGAAHLAGASGAQAIKTMGTRGVALSIVHRLHLMALSMAGGVLFFFDKDKVTRAEMEREVAHEEQEEAALDQEMAQVAADRVAGGGEIGPESGESAAPVK